MNFHDKIMFNIEKFKEKLDRDYNSVQKLHQQIENILDQRLTNNQENQILKLKQEKFRIKARYYKNLTRLPTSEYEKFLFNKKAIESKDIECQLFYLSQSKVRPNGK